MISTIPERLEHDTPLLFVHGAWHGAWCWERFAGWFSARGWATHAVDLPGHGASPSRRSLRWTSTREYVEAVAEAVGELPRPPVLVGHSMGGLVVQRYLEYRTHIPAAVLIAPDPVNGVLALTLRVARRHPLRLLHANATLSLWPIVGSPDRAREMLFAVDMSDDEVLVHWRRLQDESYRAYLDMIFRRPKPDRVAAPVLVIGAREDRVFTVAEMERTARAYRTEAVIVNGAAHDMMLDARWEQAAHAMAEWLNRTGVA